MSAASDRLEKPILLLVDVINRFDFPKSEPLVRGALRSAPRIRALADRARSAKVPVIYVNDHFGQWRSDFEATVDAATRPDSKGRPIAAQLVPHRSDYFVLKPQHSGFYSTPLPALLEHLQAKTLVIAGFAANYCVEFTANDAYMRGYRVFVPADCTAANTPALTRAALAHVRVTLRGDVRRSADIPLAKTAGRSRR